ncbi:MAG: DUF3788 domain-containing protein [Asgard group archaeon]|nr:DUF3788 domain-containing protein [Asgard group archaeon]
MLKNILIVWDKIMVEKNPLRLHTAEIPSDAEIFDFIGEAKKHWLEFVSFLDETYDFTPVIKYWGKNHGWIIQYRKSNRTWCALYPEKDSFTIQIIFGKKEVEKFEESRNEFGDFVVNKFDTTKQLHDGRWMFFKITDSSLIEDLKKMMKIKRKPKKK